MYNAHNNILMTEKKELKKILSKKKQKMTINYYIYGTIQ